MANVSDIIEEFIISTMGNSDNLDLSRNELADYFNCAPSQINYVLTTRFNINRGFIVESQRGGGGYIKLVKVKNFDEHFIYEVLTNLNNPISFKNSVYLLDDLTQKNFLTQEQAKTLKFAITDRALGNPIRIENFLRSNILKNALLSLLKEEQK